MTRRNGEIFMPNQTSDTNTIDALNAAVDSLANLRGGKYEGDEVWIKGDWQNPQDGDVVATENGVATIEGGSLILESLTKNNGVNLETGLKKFKSNPAGKIQVQGDSISETIRPRWLLSFTDDTWTDLVGNNIYAGTGRNIQRSGYFSEYADETADWAIETAGINLQRTKSSGTTALCFTQPFLSERLIFDANGVVYYSTMPDGGSFDIIETTGSDPTSSPVVVLNVNTNGAEDNTSKTASFPMLKGRIYWIRPVDANPVYVNAWECQDVTYTDDAKKIYNVSKAGSGYHDYTDSLLIENLSVFPYDLLILAMGTNDYRFPKDATFFRQKVELAVNHALSNDKEVLLMEMCGDSDTVTGGSSEALFKEYHEVLIDVATTTGCAMLSIDEYFGGFAEADSKGLMEDLVHPGPFGDIEIAKLMTSVLYGEELTHYRPAVQQFTEGVLVDSRKVSFSNLNIEPEGGSAFWVSSFGSTKSSPVSIGAVVSGTERPANPYEGMLVYRSDNRTYISWDGAAWVTALTLP